METGQTKRIAIVHDWLTSFAGSERVVRSFLEVYPAADLFSTIDFLSDSERKQFGGHHARTTFAQRLPGVQRHYAKYLPLLMLAVEQIDLSKYDLVISSSHAVAKGVITGPDQLHISYVHSPMRYAWDLQHQYLQEANLSRGLRSGLARMMLHYARMWDSRTAHGVDHFLANSNYIARRIRKVYRRESTVIHPPVDTLYFNLAEGKDKEDFYLTASRMVPYKRVPTVVEAFRHLPKRRLVVIGDGPERAAVKAMAGSNVEILGRQPDSVVRDLMQRAKAFVFAAEEDFGITPVEAQACGTPVIAYGRGGVLDSVVNHGVNRTGAFFNEPTASSIAAAIEQFEREQKSYSSAACRHNAERFGNEQFRKQIARYVSSVADPQPIVASMERGHGNWADSDSGQARANTKQRQYVAATDADDDP